MDDRKGVIKIINYRDSLDRVFWKNRQYRKDKSFRDSLIIRKKNLEKDHRIVEIFSGQFSEIKGMGYYHPILFKAKDKYGYFPMNKTAKYKSINRFKGNFAEFELPNGRKGWLDLNGNEYLN
jgi:hypothetical protein